MSEPGHAIPAADALPVQREAMVGFRIARLTIGPVYRLLFRLRVFGRENIPRDGPYVLIFVPVLPVALTGTKDLWLRKGIELRIGRRIAAAGLEVEQLVEIARQRVEDLLPAYVEQPGWKPFRHLLTRLL